jgi:hypothetical protein
LRLRGRARSCLRLRLGLRFRSALLGNRMRCADDHRGHRGKRTKPKTNHPRSEYDSALQVV